jgi:cellulose synthase/poly-beta-1,6-N-acetylglucosamine synthase-like glycosyltransferase
MTQLMLQLAQGQLTLAMLVILPFLLHRMRALRWCRLGLPELPEVAAADVPHLTLVLPTWNEGLIIEGKLRDVAAQEYPRDKLELIIIDAASDDDTIERIENWLAQNPDELGPAVSTIIEEERLGKSFSINRAFGAARPEAEILMMSDVDCRLTPGALMHVGRRLSDPLFGAVTGRQVLLNPDQNRTTGQEVTYRDMYTAFRVGESCRDSTPIFHGECAAFRREAIAGHKLVEGANADDSQMAVAVRRNGFRAVYDPQLQFMEMAPPDSKAQSVQKVRRAQGLVRHFWRNRDTWFRPRYGAFGWTMGAQGWMHIIAPWLVIIGFLVGFGLLGAVNTALFAPTNLDVLVQIMLVADGIVLLLLLCGALRLPLPLSGVAWTFLVYMLTLWRGQILILSGRSLHRWQQVTAVRQQLADYEAEQRLGEQRPGEQ